MADWKTSLKIHSLARDLRLAPKGDPVEAIKAHCNKRIRGFLREFPGTRTLHDLLQISANKLQTRFEEIRTDSDLAMIVDKYLTAGEKGFALLDRELDSDVFGITFKRTKPKSWEPTYVSVIDGRGSKEAKRYFTKWHELGHLLILTDQLRLEFRRTHVHPDDRDPEERLVDVLAGEFGFLFDLVEPYVKGQISFDKIEQIRASLCPESSQLAALIGITKAWSHPCLLVRAESGLRKKEQRGRAQSTFAFVEAPEPALRAVRCAPNEEARRSGMLIFRNMRVPESSIIAEIFQAGSGHGSRIEYLDSWMTTDGTQLPSERVHIEARWSHDGVDAIISSC